MAQKQNTRELILDAALTLFSEKGFDGVGVDQIGEAVGMKGPSLYKHFKGKDAILDALIDQVNEHYQAGFASGTRLPDTLQELVDISLQRLAFTIHDPQIVKVRRLLAMEQFRNEKLKALTTQHHLTRLQSMNAACLSHLMALGRVKKADPELLALEFTAPVTLLVHLIDREPEKEQEAMDLIRRHMSLFTETWGI